MNGKGDSEEETIYKYAETIIDCMGMEELRSYAIEKIIEEGISFEEAKKFFDGDGVDKK